jgi:hypothetical protein
MGSKPVRVVFRHVTAQASSASSKYQGFSCCSRQKLGWWHYAASISSYIYLSLQIYNGNFLYFYTFCDEYEQVIGMVDVHVMGLNMENN